MRQKTIALGVLFVLGILLAISCDETPPNSTQIQKNLAAFTGINKTVSCSNGNCGNNEIILNSGSLNFSDGKSEDWSEFFINNSANATKSFSLGLSDYFGTGNSILVMRFSLHRDVGGGTTQVVSFEVPFSGITDLPPEGNTIQTDISSAKTTIDCQRSVKAGNIRTDDTPSGGGKKYYFNKGQINILVNTGQLDMSIDGLESDEAFENFFITGCTPKAYPGDKIISGTIQATIKNVATTPGTPGPTPTPTINPSPTPSSTPTPAPTPTVSTTPTGPNPCPSGAICFPGSPKPKPTPTPCPIGAICSTPTPPGSTPTPTPTPPGSTATPTPPGATPTPTTTPSGSASPGTGGCQNLETGLLQKILNTITNQLGLTEGETGIITCDKNTTVQPFSIQQISQSKIIHRTIVPGQPKPHRVNLEYANGTSESQIMSSIKIQGLGNDDELTFVSSSDADDYGKKNPIPSGATRIWTRWYNGTRKKRISRPTQLNNLYQNPMNNGNYSMFAVAKTGLVVPKETTDYTLQCSGYFTPTQGKQPLFSEGNLQSGQDAFQFIGTPLDSARHILDRHFAYKVEDVVLRQGMTYGKYNTFLEIFDDYFDVGNYFVLLGQTPSPPVGSLGNAKRKLIKFIRRMGVTIASTASDADLKSAWDKALQSGVNKYKGSLFPLAWQSATATLLRVQSIAWLEQLDNGDSCEPAKDDTLTPKDAMKNKLSSITFKFMVLGNRTIRGETAKLRVHVNNGVITTGFPIQNGVDPTKYYDKPDVKSSIQATINAGGK